MCGIAGIISSKENSICNQAIEEQVLQMSQAISHRGPDSYGVWCSNNHQLALGHRRLSIIDLSEGGWQPKSSNTGRFVIVFNGEIYNYRLLKERLIGLGYKFSSTSDTEVVLSSFEEYGVAEALKHLDGMFALAVYDKKEDLVYLARDRFGEKPLYYGWAEGSKDLFYFASELKAITAVLENKPKINMEACGSYFRFGYIPQPLSIYQNFWKLPPGTFLCIPIKQNFLSRDSRNCFSPYPHSASSSLSLEVSPKYFWRPEEILINEKFYSEKKSDRRFGTPQSILNELNKRLESSVKNQMISDVPLGSFLSGGIDSSLVTALMQKNSRVPIKTFTIGFKEKQFNEAQHAKEIAQYLKTDHHELYIEDKDLLSLVPELSSIYDEPLADASQIPTIILARFARQQVKVALTGDGGDELFGGYNRYAHFESLYKKISLLPHSVRVKISKRYFNNKIGRGENSVKSVAKLFSPIFSDKFSKARLEKVIKLLPARNSLEVYHSLISLWQNPKELLREEFSDNIFFDNLSNLPEVGKLEKILLYDIKYYLSEDLLAKIDRAAMSVALETRAPLLGKEVAEFALSIPGKMKLRHSSTKIILKDLLESHIPQKLFVRPKMGFSPPISYWIKKPLREWAMSNLEQAIKSDSSGMYNSTVIKKFWEEHQKGTHDWGMPLWNLIMFESWKKNWT